MADSTVSSLTAISSLSGTDLFYTIQGGVDYKETLTQLTTFVQTLPNDHVTYAKMQNVSAASKLLGRGSASGSGDVEEITIGTGLSMSSTTLNNTVTSDWVLLSSQSSSGVSTINFTGLSSIYYIYKIFWHDVRPSSDGAALYFRTSTNGGSSYDAGASDYSWHKCYISSSVTGDFDTTFGALAINHNVGFDTGEFSNGELTIYRPSVAVACNVNWTSNYVASNTNYQSVVGGGRRVTSADVDAVQFLFSSGSLDDGTWRMYGLRA